MTAYRPSQKLLPYGLHIPFDQGYDADSRRNAPQADDNHPSGQFQRADGSTLPLWITDVTADFSLSGEAGQSRLTREFFPRSFNKVTLKISGNVASTQEFNRLAAFVRESHWDALQTATKGTGTSPLVTFSLYNRTPRKWNTAQGVKGRHLPWVVSGYIASVRAGATRWETAPEFVVGFIVAASQSSASRGGTGLWSDSLEGSDNLKTFAQLVNADSKNDHTRASGFTKSPIAPLQPKKQSKTTHRAHSSLWSRDAAKKMHNR